jgi:hypothetical protein
VWTLADKKVVPARNNFTKSDLRKNSRALDLQNRDPNFVYEYKATDPNHPFCLKKTGQLGEHEHGNQAGGFVTIQGWQPVHRQTDPNLAPLEAREDQGKPIDTTIRYGSQILCRMPRDEYEKYAVADGAYQDAIQKQVFSPERSGDGTARMTAVVSDDPNADRIAMLRNSGHPVPGIA